MSHPPRPLPHILRPLAAAALAAVAWSCGDGRGPSEPAPRLTALRVRLTGRALLPAATADTVGEGAEQGVTVTGVTRDGRDTTVTGVTLTTSDSAVLALSELTSAGSFRRYGTATARATGRVVLAAQVGGVRGELAVTVLRGEVGVVQVRTAAGAMLPGAVPDSVPVRTTRGYSTAVFARAGQGSGRLLGRAVAWTTSDSAVAGVTPDGVLEGRQEGAVVLRATVEGVTDSVAVVVRPPLAARIAFVTAPDSVQVRRSDSVRVVLYDSAGVPSAVRARVVAEPGGVAGTDVAGTVTLDVGPPGSDALVVTGTRTGVAQLVATGDGLTVRRALPVVRLPQGPPGAYPAAVNAVTGATVLLAARGQDVDGFSQPAAVTYAVDDPAVATVAPAGANADAVVVTANGPGTTTVRVRTGGTQTDVAVTVVAASDFAIAVRPATATPLPDRLAAALRGAAASWERAIVADLPDLRFTLPPDACGAVTATEELEVDDVLVFAAADSIDGRGGVLARAGPCIIRSADGTAAVGRVEVDSADVDGLATSGQLEVVLRHELGHVLGIGTLWGRPSLGLIARGGGGWRYRGKRALGVGDWWNRLVPDGAGGVPLGEANGPGAGHWAEGTFDNELMTPRLNFGANPLSLITLEALADLGYMTSAGAAEAYALYPGTAAGGPAPSRVPNAFGAPGAAVGAAGAPFEELIVPRWRAAPGGRVLRLPGAAR